MSATVNDPYVMQAWQESEQAQGIHFVADPFAEFTHAMGMSVDHREIFVGGNLIGGSDQLTRFLGNT